MERIGHAEILLSDLASGYWRAVMNEQDPTGEGIMGERVMQYWAQYPENVNVDLPDTAAQDSASTSNNPAVSG